MPCFKAKIVKYSQNTILHLVMFIDQAKTKQLGNAFDGNGAL